MQDIVTHLHTQNKYILLLFYFLYFYEVQSVFYNIMRNLIMLHVILALFLMRIYTMFQSIWDVYRVLLMKIFKKVCKVSPFGCSSNYFRNLHHGIS